MYKRDSHQIEGLANLFWVLKTGDNAQNPSMSVMGMLQQLSRLADAEAETCGRGITHSSFTIKTSERGVPSGPMPSCASQSDENKKKRPSLETVPRGCV